MLRTQFCKHVRIHRVNIDNIGKSIGTNGIVVDSSQHVHVTDCNIATGDKEDAIVIKAGARPLLPRPGSAGPAVSLSPVRSDHQD